MTIPEAILALSRSPELSILLKATVLLTLALVVVRMAGRSRAAVRHLILASTFAALAALPLVIAAASRSPGRYRCHAFEAGADRRGGAGCRGH